MSTELRTVLPIPRGATATDTHDGFVIEGQELVFTATRAKKPQKTIMNTLVAHAKNMLRGVQEGHLYKLKICSGHFPMNVVVSGNEFVIKNFLGEKFPRKITLKPGVAVKVAGTEVTVEAPDKELAGLTAAAIEQLTKIANRDRRVFQDGI